MDIWYLSLMFGAAFNAQVTTSNTLVPVQIQKFGPMTKDQCLQAADAMNKAPGFAVSCQNDAGTSVSYPCPQQPLR